MTTVYTIVGITIFVCVIAFIASLQQAIIEGKGEFLIAALLCIIMIPCLISIYFLPV